MMIEMHFLCRVQLHVISLDEHFVANLFQNQFQVFQQEFSNEEARLNESIRTLKDEKSNLESELKIEREKNISNVQQSSDSNSISDELKSEREKNSILDEKLSNLEKEKLTLEENIKNLNQEIDQLKSQIQSNKLIIDDLNSKNKVLDDEKQSIQDNLNENLRKMEEIKTNLSENHLKELDTLRNEKQSIVA